MKTGLMDRAAIFNQQWAIVQRAICRKRAKAEKMRAYRTPPTPAPTPTTTTQRKDTT